MRCPWTCSRNILGNLSWLLEKGEAFATAKKIEPSVLLGSRLAPDMFPLTRQVQVAVRHRQELRFAPGRPGTAAF